MKFGVFLIFFGCLLFVIWISFFIWTQFTITNIDELKIVKQRPSELTKEESLRIYLQEEKNFGKITLDKIVNSFPVFLPNKEKNQNLNSATAGDIKQNGITNTVQNSKNNFTKTGIDDTDQEKKSNQPSLKINTRIAPKVGGNPPGTEFNVLPQVDGKLSNSDLTNAKFMTKNFYPISILDSNNSIAESPIRIVIPILGIDSIVEDLGVEISSNSRSWETPKNVVGHIPSTAKPSEEGSGWYFGHLESPIRGEGNVFRRLPEIPRLVKENRSVLIYIQDINRTYLYEVYKADVVYQDELFIKDSGERDIFLVTCYPRLKYDYRIIITAAMVGVTEIERQISPKITSFKVN